MTNKLFLVFLLVMSSVQATVNLSYRWQTKDVWNGMTKCDKPVFIPKLEASFAEQIDYNSLFCFSTYGSPVFYMGERQIQEHGGFDKVNFNAKMFWKYEQTTLSVGHHYRYFATNRQNDYHKYFFEIKQDWYMSPYVGFYKCVNRSNGHYFKYGILKPIKLSKRFILTPDFYVIHSNRDYNSYYFNNNHATLSEGTGSLNLEFKFLEDVSFNMFVCYSTLIDNSLHESYSTKYKTKDNVYGGMSIIVKF